MFPNTTHTKTYNIIKIFVLKGTHMHIFCIPKSSDFKKTPYFNFEVNKIIWDIGEKNRNYRDPDKLLNMGYQVVI